MKYTDYIASYQAKQEREAQLLKKYSDKPAPVRNKALWSINSVERHRYPDLRLWFRLAVCIALFGGIILLYCMFA